ncbi:hypothetical protein [Paraburkholderia sp. BL6669N2]|uniref:hypothetical protein n=1 Tax=Paraburkholderia sp. BL6669N2 TaxID=1938807 RepID=UPI0021632A54|nr:hypothetical protein [Paraburkholderia sp. BL6669N2]
MEVVNQAVKRRLRLMTTPSFPAIWILSAAYFSLLAATATLFFFSPTILREAGFGGFKEIGRAVAGACALGALGNVLLCSIGGSAQRRRLFCGPLTMYRFDAQFDEKMPAWARKVLVVSPPAAYRAVTRLECP